MPTVLLSKSEGVLDDVARLAEFSDVFAVDEDLNPAGVADAHQCVLSVERLGRPGRKRTLNANTAVNGDPEPRRSREHQGQGVGAPQEGRRRRRGGAAETAGVGDGVALASASVALLCARRIVSSL